MISLTIDGVEVTVPKGTLLIRAAEAIGVEEVIDVSRILIDGLLDEAHAQGSRIEIAVRFEIGSDRADVMDSCQLETVSECH